MKEIPRIPAKHSHGLYVSIIGFDELGTWCSLNRLYVIDAYNFQIVMSLPAMSLGLTFCASRKGGTGEVGGFNTGPR